MSAFDTMNWVRLKLQLRALLLRRQAEEDLDEEVRFHIAMETRKLLSAGMQAPEAGGDARRRFGGIAQIMEQCRDARGLGWIETAWQDVRYALRGFGRTRGFALTVVATIALGLGLNTACFTAFNAYVLRPLSVRDPYSLYRVTLNARDGIQQTLRWRDFQDLRELTAAFSEVVGLTHMLTRVEGHLMIGDLVTTNYFSMIGVNADAGSMLVEGDSLVLSASAWKNKFGGDPGIVGRKMAIQGRTLEVVGVAREGFTGVGEVPLDFWASYPDQPDHPEGIRIVGRLRRGWSARQAEAALTPWARQRNAGLPEAQKVLGVRLQSEATKIAPTREIMLALSPIAVTFVLVLLVACANVANMMLARAMARQREIGVRLALGAGRPRLIRQLLTEGVLLALPAGAAGFAVSQAALGGFQRLAVATIPRDYVEYIVLLPLNADWRVLGFMLGAAVVAALLFGMAPAIQATRSNVMQAARGEFTADVRPARLRNALVIAQVAVSVLILVCAAVLLRANNRLQSVDVGLRTHGVIDIEIQQKFRTRVIQRLLGDPEVQVVASASKAPFAGIMPWTRVIPADGSQRDWASYQAVSPEYFGMFALPILRGRNFTADEAAAGAPVAVISEATARHFFRGRDPLGQTIRFGKNERQREQLRYAEVRVIGVARDAVNGWIGDGIDRTCIFLPHVPRSGGVLLARVAGDVRMAKQRLDRALAEAVPGAVDEIHTMDDVLAAQTYPFRALYWASAGVGGLALLLTLSGIYGVMSYVVTQRRKEIGIRMALGASARQIARLVLRQSVKLAGAGIVLGALAAWGAIRMLAALVELQMFEGVDGAAYVMAAALVLAAAACATWVPTARAARIEPVTTLRCD